MNKTLFFQIIIIISIVSAYFLIDFNKVYSYFKGETLYFSQNKDCDLHKTSCEITLDNNEKYELEVFPKEIPLMQNLKFRLKSSKKDLKELKINIYATNMFMGYFNLKLKNLGNGIYEANGTLPTCPVGNMKWNADIELVTKGVRFNFQTTR